jgi:hypothetical protein
MKKEMEALSLGLMPMYTSPLIIDSNSRNPIYFPKVRKWASQRREAQKRKRSR